MNTIEEHVEDLFVLGPTGNLASVQIIKCIERQGLCLDSLVEKLNESYKRKKASTDVVIGKSTAELILEILAKISVYHYNEFSSWSHNLRELLLDIYTPHRFGNNVVIDPRHVNDIFFSYSQNQVTITDFMYQDTHDVRVIARSGGVRAITVSGFLPAVNDQNPLISTAQAICLRALFAANYWVFCPEELMRRICLLLTKGLRKKKCESTHLEFIIDLVQAKIIPKPEILIPYLFKSMVPVFELAIDTIDGYICIQACHLISWICSTYIEIGYDKLIKRPEYLVRLESNLETCRYINIGEEFQITLLDAEARICFLKLIKLAKQFEGNEDV